MPHFEVFGVDHSPWVQTVLLGLYEKRVSHTLTTVPPLSVFRESGIWMPAASVDGEPWQRESAAILQRVGYGPITREDKHALYAAWQGVLHRPDSAVAFWSAFSLCRDENPSRIARLRNHFLRSFSTFYFFLLIRVAVLGGRRPKPENFGDQFLVWNERLEASAEEFLGGAEPDILDVTLFGILQCHSSIPVPPLAALQHDPRLDRLRVWIGAMQVRFVGYRHLYSGVHFAPHAPAPPPASGLERAAFWLGSAFMWAAFPITIPLVFYFVRRNASRR